MNGYCFFYTVWVCVADNDVLFMLLLMLNAIEELLCSEDIPRLYA